MRQKIRGGISVVLCCRNGTLVVRPARVCEKQDACERKYDRFASQLDALPNV